MQKTKAKSKNVFVFSFAFAFGENQGEQQTCFGLSPWFWFGALFFACAPSPPSFASRLRYRVLSLTFAVALNSFDHRIHNARGDCRLGKSSTLHAPEALESLTRPAHQPRSLQQPFGPLPFVQRIFENALAARTRAQIFRKHLNPNSGSLGM